MQTGLENLSKEELIKIAKQQLAGQKSLEREAKSLEREAKALERKAQAQEPEIERLTRERDYLKAQVEMFQRMQFGQMRERFQGDPNQTLLPFEADPAQVEQQQEEIKEKIKYVRKRPNHHGRAKLTERVPVEEIEIRPQGDLSQMGCIGKEITEELECEPAKFYIKRYIRFKYAAKIGEGVKIAELPERVIDKGIPG